MICKKMKKIIHIVAKNNLNYIGKNNDLLYHLKDDMKRFKRLTTGNIVVMGLKTYKSLKNPLKNRFNVVISDVELDVEFDNVKVVYSIDEAIEFGNSLDFGENIFIIGGGSIYSQTLDSVDELWITQVDDSTVGDIKYPEIPLDKFKITRCSGFHTDGDFETEYQTWERIK